MSGLFLGQDAKKIREIIALADHSFQEGIVKKICTS